MRLRVMRTCMMFTLPSTTSSSDGIRTRVGSGVGSSAAKPSCRRRSQSAVFFLVVRHFGGQVGLRRWRRACANGGPECRRSGPRRSRCRRHGARQRHGHGLTRPPSTNRRPSRWAGVNRPGKAMEARTASAVEPVRSHTSLPECRPVATAAKGMSSASMGRSEKRVRKNSMTRSPLSMPPASLKSMNENTVRPVRPSAHCSKRSSSPSA